MSDKTEVEDLELAGCDEVQPASNVIELSQFLDDFGRGLMDSVSNQNPPVFDNNIKPEWDDIMDQLKRKPFDAQRERVHAICHLLSTENEQAGILNGEMGCGKTMMGIAAAAVLFSEGYRRTLVISPPHLVYKWCQWPK